MPRNDNKFIEICCAVALAGEISIVAAKAANHLKVMRLNKGSRKIIFNSLRGGK